MILILVGDIFGGILSAILGLVGLVCLIILQTTAYYDMGIALGYTILGIVSTIYIIVYSLVFIFNDYEFESKFFTVWGIMQIIVTIGLLIFGYVSPRETGIISYSRIASIFGKPVFFLAVLAGISIGTANAVQLSIGAFDGIREYFWSFVVIIILEAAFVIGGVGIVGINYFRDNKNFLAWVDTNFHYYDKQKIENRIRRYGTDDSITVLSINLQNLKDYNYSSYTSEKASSKFLSSASSKTHDGCEYRLQRYKETDEPNVYICEFIDTYQYNDEHTFPNFYCKINLNDFTVIEALDNY